MKLPLTLMIGLSVLSGCAPFAMVAEVPSKAADTASFGGLPADLAAHPSVELRSPQAFTLTIEARPFLQALSRAVEPQRRQLAARLLADPAIVNGLAVWERSNTTAQLAVLKRVAAIEGEVMGFTVPPLLEQAGSPPQQGMMAYYQPGVSDIGKVVLYPTSIARGGKYLALATLVHEMRHAGQYQLVQAADNTLSADERTLATTFGNTWDAMQLLGGEGQLAYGDYAHLSVEFDAFQTGNEVAAIVSQGTFDSLGFGFVDADFDAKAKPTLDLFDLAQRLAGSELISNVNQAEFKAESARGVNVSRQRNQVVSAPTRRGR